MPPLRLIAVVENTSVSDMSVEQNPIRGRTDDEEHEEELVSKMRDAVQRDHEHRVRYRDICICGCVTEPLIFISFLFTVNSI